MTPSDVWNLACRVLLYSTLAYNAVNNIVLEFVTSHHTGPDAMAFCMLGPAATAQVNSLREGGSQFEGGDVELVTDPTNLLSNSFFSPSSQRWHTHPLHFVNMRDLLGTDLYYSSLNNNNQRCACFFCSPCSMHATSRCNLAQREPHSLPRKLMAGVQHCMQARLGVSGQHLGGSAQGKRRAECVGSTGAGHCPSSLLRAHRLDCAAKFAFLSAMTWGDTQGIMSNSPYVCMDASGVQFFPARPAWQGFMAPLSSDILSRRVCCEYHWPCC